jgi:hypothetical protein
MEPLKLPHLPPRKDWNRAFLSDKERETLDVCLGYNIMAIMNQPR